MIELERVTERQVQELYELGFPGEITNFCGYELTPCTYIAPPKGYTGAWNNNTDRVAK